MASVACRGVLPFSVLLLNLATIMNTLKEGLTNTLNADIRYTTGRSFLGLVQVAQTEKGVCSIILGDAEEEMTSELGERFPGKQMIRIEDDPHGWLETIIAYIESPVGTVDVPLDLAGTPFQREAWETLCTIPAGSTLSYTEVAHKMGRPKAVRAVAGACASNRVAVVIPCHRVVRSDGSISGYRWGVERKRLLLDRERMCNG